MSEAARKRMKVSREGVVLIKSFEGFRPRAVAREDGGWVIGYGHTRSAREGATVTEAEAELLLQYDLIPVVEAVHAHAGDGLNQHQFDALASFAFSVGADAFAASDVVGRLRDGAPAEAADALVGWPAPVTADTALRRRAAERALFMADPGAAVTLADLLAAPLPPPAVEPAPEVQAPEPEPEPEPEAAQQPPSPSPDDARAAAVAALLGETTPTAANDGPTQHADPESVPEAPADEPAAPDPLTLSAQLRRYSPYAAVATARLEGVQTLRGATDTPPYFTPLQVEARDAAPPAPAEEPAEALSEPEIAPEPAAPEPEPEAEPQPVATDDAPVQIPTFALTPEPETPAPMRMVWPDEVRAADTTPAQEALFDDADGALAEPVLRHEAEAPPARPGWNETGAFIAMGGIGLVSFGAAMAAFRRASEEGGGDIALIGWVLAAISVICVGVSGFNLHQRLGKSEG